MRLSDVQKKKTDFYFNIRLSKSLEDLNFTQVQIATKNQVEWSLLDNDVSRGLISVGRTIDFHPVTSSRYFMVDSTQRIRVSYWSLHQPGVIGEADDQVTISEGFKCEICTVSPLLSKLFINKYFLSFTLFAVSYLFTISGKLSFFRSFDFEISIIY